MQVRDKAEEEQENQTPNSKSRTLGGTLTLRRPKKADDSEPHVDPKMATMRRNLHTEDGSKLAFTSKIPPSPLLVSSH